MVFMTNSFFAKKMMLKNSAEHIKHEKLPSRQRVFKVSCLHGAINNSSELTAAHLMLYQVVLKLCQNKSSPLEESVETRLLIWTKEAGYKIKIGY